MPTTSTTTALSSAVETGLTTATPATTRRASLLGAAALLAARAVRAEAAPAEPPLRFLKIRYGTFLVELGATRVLIDPSFAPGLSAPWFYDVPAPLDSPRSVGRIDVILVTSAAGYAFQPSSLAALRADDALCVVADDSIARALRFHGLAKVRVLEPNDDVTAHGIVVRASSAGAGPSIGFHLERDGRALWHTGRPPPLDVDASPARFAAAHPAEVVLACTEGLGGADAATVSMDPDDAMLTARLACARCVVPAYDDAPLTPLASLSWRRRAGRPPKPVPQAPRVVVAEPSTWYRVASRPAQERR